MNNMHHKLIKHTRLLLNSVSFESLGKIDKHLEKFCNKILKAVLKSQEATMHL